MSLDIYKLLSIWFQEFWLPLVFNIASALLFKFLKSWVKQVESTKKI